MKTRFIVASVQFDNISGRDILSGLFAYNEPGHRWRYRIVQKETELSAETVRGVIEEGADGFILTFLGDRESQLALIESGKPIVLLGPKSLYHSTEGRGTALIRNDNKAIGRMGGKYLASLGKFASFGFIHSKPGFNFSEDRQAAFKAYLRRTGRECKYESWPLTPEGSEADISALADWMKCLPKPAAVMAACDRRAMHALAAAKRAGVKVPKQMSLIGVDNDELLAENSEPPLTSILPGHFEMGLSAARELGRLFSSKRRPQSRVVYIPPNKVVERESTAPLTPALTLVIRAKAFIAARATKGLTVVEVSKHLGCSRNLVDLRFRECEGMTVHTAIEKARLKSVLHLVENTNRPVAVIASQCGFRSQNRLSHLFRERFGKSIREWRMSLHNQRAQMEESVGAGHPVAECHRPQCTPFRKAQKKESPRQKKGDQRED